MTVVGVLNIGLMIVLAGCQLEPSEYWHNSLSTDNFSQESRIGHAFLYEVLVTKPDTQRLLQRGDPGNDVAKLNGTLVETIEELRTETSSATKGISDKAESAEELASTLLPDVLTVTYATRNGVKVLDGYSIDKDDGFDRLAKSVLGRSDIDDELDKIPTATYIFPFLNRPSW